MNRLKLLLHFFIVPVFLLELYSRFTENLRLEYISKPWLLIWLLVYFLLFSGRKKQRFSIIMAFIFSWIGDMLLMLANTRDELFYAGVGGFFIAQIFYIYTFAVVSGESRTRGFLFSRPVWIIPFIVYLTAVMLVLLPGMEGVMIPVITVYALSLIAMSLFALNRKGKVNFRSFSLVFYGSVLFVLSDTMIAVNRFALSFPRASFIIMLTYFAAQYLIMSGLLEEWGRD